MNSQNFYEQINTNQQLMLNQMELDKKYREQQMKMEFQLVTAQRKMELRESFRQRKKNQYDEIQINCSGEIEVVTKNTENMYNRKIVNFCCPTLISIHCIEYPLRQAYLLVVKIGEERREVLFDGERMTKNNYLYRRMVSNGLRFYTNSESRARLFAESLWAQLLVQCEEEIWVPCQYGWYQKTDGEIAFCKPGDRIWKEIIEYAR